ncbi:MAG: hypothetical protein M0R47_16585 [Methylobacter sp.]|nr:hypothetical protein [Methylobacter sp.]
MSDHRRIVECECGTDSPQVITPITVVIPSHMSATGVSAYESPVSGEIITTQRQRANDLAAHDCIEYEPGMKQDTDRRVIEDDARLDKLVDETFDREFTAMPSDKREALVNEIASGATAETVRI